MSLSEFEIIKQYFSRIGLGAEGIAGHEGIMLGIGDDAAILEVGPSQQLCISTDMLVESVHFPADADAYNIGQRALAVNLSDLAAMGAHPVCFTLAISLPGQDEKWLERFSKGLLNMAEIYQCPLVGGDTTRGPLSISIQVQGVAQKGQLLLRDGARVGDAVLVTGSLGKGAIALAAMGTNVHFDASLHQQLGTIEDPAREILHDFFYAPQPRLEFAQLAAPLINSAIDISDGLAGDLRHILEQSDVGASINPHSLPIDETIVGCTSEKQYQSAALFGGDDYELCITVSQDNLPAVKEIAEQLQLPLTAVGVIESEPGLRLVDADGRAAELNIQAYDHFRDRSGS